MCKSGHLGAHLLAELVIKLEVLSVLDQLLHLVDFVDDALQFSGPLRHWEGSFLLLLFLWRGFLFLTLFGLCVRFVCWILSFRIVQKDLKGVSRLNVTAHLACEL